MPYINTKTNTLDLNIYQVREAHPEASIPEGADYGDYRWYVLADRPADTAMQVAQESQPTVINGVLTQQWVMRDMTPAEAAAKSADGARVVANKIDALWRAADKYTSSYISGVAIGILTIGVMQAKPKALSISAWSKSVWAEYYVRKALVTTDSVDNLNFASFGAMPHSIPELQAEAGL